MSPELTDDSGYKQSFCYRGREIIIEVDTNARSPQKWDMLGTLLDYSKHKLGKEGAEEELRNAIYQSHHFRQKWISDLDTGKGVFFQHLPACSDILWKPVYLYDHGGLTVATTPFTCPWDSGQIGVIFVQRARVLAEYAVPIIGARLREKVLSILDQEIKTLNQYLTGDVWGWRTEHDSCWEFFGYEQSLSEMLRQACAAIDQTT